MPGLGDMFRNLAIVVGILFFSLVVSPAFAQTTWYVDDDAPLGGDGQSWSTAFRYLQDGLQAAAADPIPGEVRIAGGTYTPDQDEAGEQTAGDRLATFEVPSGCHVRGGYAGLAEPSDPDARDIAMYETILSGDLNGDDEPDFINRAENSHHVVTATDVVEGTMLDGLTVSGGKANSDVTEHKRGGGIQNFGGDLSLNQCVVRDNVGTVGGGLYNGYGILRIVASTITGNKSNGSGISDGGGGLYHRGPGTIELIDTDFSGNKSYFTGGAIYGRTECTLHAERCNFTENEQTGALGGPVTSGAIDLTLSSGGDFSFVDCVFDRNVTTSEGGAFGLYGGGDLTFAECEFRQNEADMGGAITFYTYYDTHVTISDCLFSLNTAASSGGAIDTRNVTQFEGCMSGCTFVGNIAGRYGAGTLHGFHDIDNCYFEDNHAVSAYVGAIACSGTIRDSQFVGNSAATMSGASLVAGTAINCEFIDNTAGTAGAVSGFGEFYDCIFAQNSATDEAGALQLYDGAEVVGCRFISNTAGNGGAVFSESPVACFVRNCEFVRNSADYGGGLAWGDCPLTIENCTLSENTATDSGGGIDVVAGSVDLVNVVMVGNTASTGAGLSAEDAAVAVSYCDFEGGANGIALAGSATLTWGDGNIDLDPLFVDPDGPDNDPNTWADNDYSLAAGSPCIDAGDNTNVALCALDLAGNRRRADDPATVDTGLGDAPIVDMGAYEYASSAGTDCDGDGLDDGCAIDEGLVADCNGNGIPDSCDLRDGTSQDADGNGVPDECDCVGDLDGDHDVDLADLQLLLANYGTTGTSGVTGDFDGDDDVDLADLQLLLSVYGQVCE